MTAPAWLTPRSGPSLGTSAARFIESLCRSPRDSVAGPAGSPVKLRQWQHELLEGLLVVDEHGRLRHRTGLVGMPRKNGKTTLSAGLALWSLTTGPAGGEVYSVAGDRAQARLCFNTAKRMVEMSDELSRSLRCLRDAIECKATGSVYQVRSAEAGLSEGLSPTLTIFDEVHVQPTRDLWDTMALGAGARPESLLLGITTAGVRTDRTGRPSLAFGLYEHGRRVASGEVEDPTLFFAWFEAPPEADWRDPDTWRAANPGFGDLVAESDFASVVKRTPESEFRTKRLNQWVASEAAWLPQGAWAACEDSTRTIEDGAACVVAFDGSYSGDSTVLVAVTIPNTPEERPHVELAGLWERGLDDGPEWRVPTDEVVDAIRACCDRWAVRELPADPSLWRDVLEHLAAEGVPVVEFPQSPGRMIPATQRFYEAVMERRLTHSGDPALARHVGNARTRVARGGGLQLTKGSFGHSSPRKIDAAVAAVMGYERAALLEPEPKGIIAMSGTAWLREKGGMPYLVQLAKERDARDAETLRRFREQGHL